MAKPTDPARRVRALKALAHPARLAAVESLARGERCVCELQKVMGSDLSTVSRHLRLLVDAGLLASRRQGQWIFYRLRTVCLPDFLKCIDAVLAGGSCRALAGRK